MVLPICQTAKEPSYASVDNIPTHRSPFWIFVAQSTLLFVIVALKPASRKLSFIIALVFKPAGPLKVQSPPLTIRWILSKLSSEESYHRILLQIFLKFQPFVSSVSLKFSRFSIFHLEFIIIFLTFPNESLFLHDSRDFRLSLLSIFELFFFRHLPLRVHNAISNDLERIVQSFLLRASSCLHSSILSASWKFSRFPVFLLEFIISNDFPILQAKSRERKKQRTTMNRPHETEEAVAMEKNAWADSNTPII